MVEDAKQKSNMSIRQGDVLPAAVLANQTLGKMLERAANRDRGIVLCCWGDRLDFLSYKDLLLAASCVLRGLRQNGLQPQDKIILQLKNPRNFFISLWACWLGGFIPIPLGVEPTRKDLSPSKLHQTWELCDRPVIIGDSLNPDFSNVLSIEELLNNSGDRNYHRADLADLALLIFTSGSTGKPKGVMLSGRNLVASVYGMAKVNNLSPQDITLNWMPLEHIASLVMFHLTEVYLGCEQIQVDSELILRNPLNWLNLIDKHRVTATWSPNFAYNLVNEKLESGVDYGWDLSCLRWLGNGAEAVVGKTAGRFIELLAPYGLSAAAVSPGYGMSETTSGIAHSHNFDRRRQKDFVSVGEPIPGVSLRIVNSDNEIVPQGEVGLLQVRGETITAGYYLQPELNQEVFIDGWFNTGDLGFIEQGQLTITGRQKDVIVINGANYYNQDIETAVESISGVTVSFTAACSVTDGRQQEQVAVFFHTEKKAGSLRTLINEIRKSVFAEVGVSPAYIIPVAQETIPKTAIGKIMRSQLAQRFNAGEFNDQITEITKLFEQRDLAPQELPSSAIEQRLVKIWREVLNLKQVGVKDNFFELGGNSLLLMEVASKLSAYGISATNLFQYPTISTLAEYIQNGDRESIAAQQGKRRGELRRQAGNKDVAIIGMSCRFPGANNLEEFWQNLCNGVESISFFSDAEIINSGVDRELINHPDYVKASPILEDIEGFDADFWGFTPKEAQLLDPQQRLFLECAWESLEDAGYDSFTYSGDISLYGGAATNTYLLNNIYPNRDRLDEQNSLQVLNLSSMGGFQVSTANDKDYLTTRTSYKLNLTGSSVNVQTACSTSLVTVHLACQSLIDAECDMALAGGVSVHSPQKMGYLYQEGTIFSQDGHCRAFDADASGTIFGSGAGMVVLKLLDRAIEDGDRIYGVIKGSAVNNDGGTKVGYLAPSVDGQTRVIAEALAVADIAPDTVSYIEAHGTGTKLGDPIEVKALSQAYQQDIKKRDLCGIGSVKTNVGHLQMASGIVGLIKTVLCLYRQQIPASLHCDRPNPQLNLERTSFYINTKLQNWQSPSLPRRAGVNSLGIGGTNAHVILEEFIESKQPASNELPAYLLTLSAKNETALQNLADKYREFLAAEACSEISLRDICFTSNIGRHHFDYRYGAVAKDKQDLINQLSNISAATVGDKNQIAFLFTGQGSQYVGMAQQLYHTCKIFQSNCDRCLEILQPYIDLTAAKIFSETPSPCCDINKTQYTQPLLFTVEYSLAQMWLSWGIKPDVMVGHSIGEYVAATIAGVFDLADALKLVAVRGKLIQDLPENGAMLAVFASQERIKDLLPDTVSLAADNGSHLVLSGLKKAIADLAAELESQLIKTQLLKVSHGFHSWLMQPMIEEFAAVAKTIKYSVPKISIISNLTGDLAAENIATPDYWVEHILKPVQFAKSIKYLDRQGIEIFLEIGTKPILTGMTNSILEHKLCLPTLDSKNSDWSSILSTLSQLYNRGVEIDWQMVTKNYGAQKTSLPTYPFQRKRYWFDPPHKSEYIKTSPKDLVHPLLGEHIASPLKQTILQSNLQIDTVAWLQDHHVEDKAIFPGAAYLELAIALAIFKQQELPLAIKDFNIVAPLYINQNSQIQSILDPQKEYLSCEIYSLDNDNWQLHAKGKILSAVEPARKENLEALKLEFEQSELDIKQHYQNCQAKGINYGKSFQGIKELYGKNERALGLIELPTHLDSQAYKFHPALLDACLQIIFAALPQELQSKTYIPVDIEKFTLYRLPDRKVWSYLELISLESDRCIANVWLYDETGELVAKLQGLKSQVIKSKPAWHDWLYQQQWQLQSLATQINLSQNGTWLIFNDRHNRGEQVAAQLTAHNHKCCLITRDDIEDNPLAYIDLVKQHPSLTGIVYLWSLDKTQDWLECQSYLYLVQALIQHPHNPSLWFVTHNAQPVNGDRLTESSISNSCLWGMQKAIALEHPKLNCTGIDLDSPQNLPDILIREIGTQQNEPVAYRNNRRYVSRLVKYNRQTSKKSDRQLNQQLEIKDPGNLDSLQWKPSSRQQPQDNEIQIAVKATGLNFRDVMVALDLYPDKTKFLGLECSGIVTAVGKNVSSFKLGDQVTAISDSSFSQYLNVNSLLAIHQPESLSFEEMATIPVTFLTAYYTLVHLAKLQPGEKILIHAAAGGVGLAAIQIAQNIGAEIYATASTPKWELLKSMGVTKIMNSRNLDFAEEVMPATNNQGVDVVLNSLSGEFIAKSIAVLKDNGRFIEIGKQDIWTKNDVLREKLNIKYHIVDLWLITQEKPELIQQMLGQLSQQFIAKQLKPLPITKFDSNKAIAAFRYMQQGKHQGKIIITPPSQHFEGTYLIAGGMGAIGLRIAQWLIDKGVENLVLIGRNDIKPQYQDLLEKLQEKSHITCIKADISNTEQLKQALKIIKLTLPTLKGIVHCAGVTSDRTIAQQDWNSFAKVLAPKTQGAWNLHDLTQEYDLENFIMFSSAASLIGSSGQANYCAANVFLDALAHLRRSLGLPGISINWGAWRNTGLAADANITASLEQKGINAIEPERGIEILEELLLDNPRQMGVIPINWDTWQKNNTVTNFYENLIDGDRFKTDSTENSTVKQQLLNASYEQKKILLVEQISQQVGNILGTKDINQIDLELGFSELGLDSLSSVELRNKLQSIYNIKLPSTVIFDYFNIKSLANHLLSLLFTSKSLSIEEQTIVEERQLLDIENISETEAEKLLLQELEDIDL